MAGRPKYSYDGGKGVRMASWNGKSFKLTKSTKNQQTQMWEECSWFMAHDLQSIIDMCQKALADIGEQPPATTSNAAVSPTRSMPVQTGFEGYPNGALVASVGNVADDDDIPF